MEKRASVGAAAWIALTLIVTAGCAARPEAADDLLLAGFLDPPARARPDAFWPWLNRHVDPTRLTGTPPEVPINARDRSRVRANQSTNVNVACAEQSSGKGEEMT